MKTTLKFKSVGKKHNDEASFFEFLVNQKFNEEGSKAIKWCAFNELEITIEALEPEIVKWAENTIGEVIDTPTGYIFVKNN